MIYLICQDWSNTSKNHAGIKYLCNQLENLYPHKFKTIVFPDYGAIFNNRKLPFSQARIIRTICYHYARIRHQFIAQKTYKSLKKILHRDDKVILMEYLEKSYPMLHFAESIKIQFPDVPLLAMVHLVPEKIESSFPIQEDLKRWLKPIDKILTLGHSLTDYFIEKGVDKTKIITTFHYVDNYYYTPTPIRKHNRIKIIAMGNQMRNIALLKKIVEANPNADFIICQGTADMSSFFKKIDNVQLIPYVEEKVLKQYMIDADISLNVMKDTIGSNVIVTSLGMGLAMICSDVGSIRDYCDETNTIFCNNKNPEEFSQAISSLEKAPHKLMQLQQSAANKGRTFSIQRFANDIISKL